MKKTTKEKKKKEREFDKEAFGGLAKVSLSGGVVSSQDCYCLSLYMWV
ncbi:hypothetical protein TIFTF001_012547 [Ficus carica]|uniref:Uncharacterized protein n=1 Tax=Ficus carica TaxID=3494 RepID=A0AA88D3T4_FICCA|nr:hypothetical protein TIFTF001_012547 [Ficus carica]